MRGAQIILSSLAALFFLQCGLGADQAYAVEEPSTAAKPLPEQTAVVPRVVMVRVGNEDITVQNFLNHINQSTELLGRASTPEGKASVLRDMIGMVLLRQAMVEQGLLSPEVTDLAVSNNAYRKLAEKHFPLPPIPAEDEVQKYYRAHPEYFGIPAMARISHIQFRVPANVKEEAGPKALARVTAALDRLNAGESFNALAAELSDNENTRVQGGDAGFLDRGTPWLHKALDGIKVGGHTGIVESPAGYEIILLTEEREALVRPFAEVSDEAAFRLRAEAQEQARQAYIKKLAAKTKIVMELEGLESARP